MVSLAQKRFAGCLGSEHAGLTFDAEVAVEAAMLRNKANDGLGEMNVEVVADDIPPCDGGGAAQQCVEKTCKVLLGPGVADHPGDCIRVRSYLTTIAVPPLASRTIHPSSSIIHVLACAVPGRPRFAILVP